MQNARCFRTKCTKIVQPDGRTRGDQPENCFGNFYGCFFEAGSIWKMGQIRITYVSQLSVQSLQLWGVLVVTPDQERFFSQKDAPEVINLRCRSLEAEPSWHLAAFSLWRQSIREHLENSTNPLRLTSDAPVISNLRYLNQKRQSLRGTLRCSALGGRAFVNIVKTPWEALLLVAKSSHHKAQLLEAEPLWTPW